MTIWIIKISRLKITSNKKIIKNLRRLKRKFDTFGQEISDNSGIRDNFTFVKFQKVEEKPRVDLEFFKFSKNIKFRKPSLFPYYQSSDRKQRTSKKFETDDCLNIFSKILHYSKIFQKFDSYSSTKAKGLEA